MQLIDDVRCKTFRYVVPDYLVQGVGAIQATMSLDACRCSKIKVDLMITDQGRGQLSKNGRYVGLKTLY